MHKMVLIFSFAIAGVCGIVIDIMQKRFNKKISNFKKYGFSVVIFIATFCIVSHSYIFGILELHFTGQEIVKIADNPKTYIKATLESDWSQDYGDYRNVYLIDFFKKDGWEYVGKFGSMHQFKKGDLVIDASDNAFGCFTVFRVYDTR